MCLAAMTYVYAACQSRVTIFETDGKFHLV